MPGILPDPVTGGGVVIRDGAGVPTNPPDVSNAYSPPAAFVSSCELTALPSTCDARIEPAQINAIVSELMALAECFDPNGPWNCASVTNLCAAFTAWVELWQSTIFSGPVAPVDPALNALWWDTANGVLKIWYDDGIMPAWVEITGTGIRVDHVSIIGAATVANPLRVGIIDAGTY